jgi:predicted transcriptional regulator
MERIQPVFIRKTKVKKYPSIDSLDEMRSHLQDTCKREEKIIILLDGLHYFLTRFSFEELISTLYEVNEMISDSQMILLLYLDPSICLSDEVAILRSEFEALPSKKVDDITIKDELFDIISFVNQENKKNALVSYKKIMTRFDIVYYTASKRVNQLSDEGLVFTKKYGKSRVVHLTQKAKTLLEKRKAI